MRSLCSTSESFLRFNVGLEKWTMTPFRDNGKLTQNQQRYNHKNGH